MLAAEGRCFGDAEGGRGWEACVVHGRGKLSAVFLTPGQFPAAIGCRHHSGVTRPFGASRR